MPWQDTAERLLDAIIRRDEAAAARISVELCSPNGDQWSFLRWDGEDECLRPVYPPRAEKRVEIGSEARVKLEKGEMLVDNMDSPSEANGEGAGRGARGALWVPLVYQERFLGVLSGKGDWKEGAPSGEFGEQVRLLARTWFLVGLLEEKERLLYTDHLTGLYNADFLIDFLKKELARCARYERRIAVVFLDIDWFKNVNDLHGHLTGSHVLRETARLLIESSRDSDVLVRYGGDEFVALLPETGARDAMDVAERLRRRIEGHEFQLRQGPSVRCTISAGVAVYPEHGAEVSDLIHQADLAMYVAKHSNKNCVKLAVS